MTIWLNSQHVTAAAFSQAVVASEAQAWADMRMLMLDYLNISGLDKLHLADNGEHTSNTIAAGRKSLVLIDCCAFVGRQLLTLFLSLLSSHLAVAYHHSHHIITSSSFVLHLHSS